MVNISFRDQKSRIFHTMDTLPCIFKFLPQLDHFLFSSNHMVIFLLYTAPTSAVVLFSLIMVIFLLYTFTSTWWFFSPNHGYLLLYTAPTSTWSFFFSSNHGYLFAIHCTSHLHAQPNLLKYYTVYSSVLTRSSFTMLQHWNVSRHSKTSLLPNIISLMYIF